MIALTGAERAPSAARAQLASDCRALFANISKPSVLLVGRVPSETAHRPLEQSTNCEEASLVCSPVQLSRDH